MFRNKAKWLGVGAVALGLSLPFTAQAHGDEKAVAFITGAAVGAAVGYAVGDDGHKHRQVHYSGHPRSWHGYPKRYTYKHHRKAQKRWARHHREWHRKAPDSRWERHAERAHYRDHQSRDRYAGNRNRDRSRWH